MDINELKSIWQENNDKLEKALKLNSQTLHLIQTQKIKSQLKPLYWQRIFEISCHSIALILLLLFLCNNITYFTYAASAIVLMVFYTYLFFNCLNQIKLLNTIDANNDIITMQSALMKIQTYLIEFRRLTLLFVPAFLSYPVVISKAIADLNITVFGDFDIINSTNGSWWYAEFITFVIIVPFGLWFYNQISIKNSHKKWVKRIINNATSLRVKKAISFLNELENIDK